MEFYQKSLLEQRKLSIEELSQYYMEKRKYEYENGKEISKQSIAIRRKIHSTLLQIVKIDRLLNHEKIVVLKDERIKNDHPKVYAATHIGGNDIQRTFESIKEPAYLFLGDPKELYRDKAGLLLFLNGTICLETRNKIDRGIAKKRSIELLQKGGNLLIYPEGAWNIMPNLPVMKLYKGAVNIAVTTQADIIPVALEEYQKTFYISIGKNIVTRNYSNINTDILNTNLRDAMATEKWHILEHLGVFLREKVATISVEDYQQAIVDKCTYDFTLQDVFDTMYKESGNPAYNDDFINKNVRKRVIN